jgi:hypothetical protein
MTDDELDDAFAYGALPRSTELWEMFRQYVERWDAERDLAHTRAAERFAAENPGLLIQASIRPLRCTPMTVAWLEWVRTEVSQEHLKKEASHRSLVASLQQELQHQKLQQDALRLDQELLRNLIASREGELNGLLTNMLEAKAVLDLWLPPCIFAVPFFAIVITLWWLGGSEVSIASFLLVYWGLVGAALAVAIRARFRMRMYFRHLRSLIERLNQLGVAVYRSEGISGPRLAARPLRCAAGVAIVDPNKTSIRSLAYDLS